MFDLAAVTRVERSGWLAVGRRRVCIGQAMDLFALAVEAVAEESQTVFVVRCWEAYPAVVRANFRMMIVLAELEVALRSMIVEACSAHSAESWTESRVVVWHTACRRSLLHLDRLTQRHRQLEVVSSPDVQSVLERSVLLGCMPLAQAGVVAAVAVGADAVLVAARRRLLQTAPILVGLGMSAPKPYSLLEDGSVYRLQSFPAVEQRGSWSRDAQLDLLWKMRVRVVCPTFPMAWCSASDSTGSRRPSPSTSIRRWCESCRDISAHCVRRTFPSATLLGWQSTSGPTQR